MKTLWQFSSHSSLYQSLKMLSSAVQNIVSLSAIRVMAGLIWASLVTAVQPLADRRPLCEGIHWMKKGGGEVGQEDNSRAAKMRLTRGKQYGSSGVLRKYFTSSALASVSITLPKHIHRVDSRSHLSAYSISCPSPIRIASSGVFIYVT